MVFRRFNKFDVERSAITTENVRLIYLIFFQYRRNANNEHGLHWLVPTFSNGWMMFKFVFESYLNMS